jgi:hypothetical protein
VDPRDGQLRARRRASKIEFESLATTVEPAFELAGNCAKAYEQAPPRVRRRFNQQLFERLLIEDEEVARAGLGEVLPDLLDRAYVNALVREASNPGALSSGRDSNKTTEVRPGRLELPPRIRGTRPSTLRVYQFRHRRVVAGDYRPGKGGA